MAAPWHPPSTTLGHGRTSVGPVRVEYFACSCVWFGRQLKNDNPALTRKSDWPSRRALKGAAGELTSSTRESREDLTVKHANASCNKNESLGRRARGLTRVGGAWGLMVSLAAAAALAQAQAPSASAAAPAPKPADTSFTWNGITLYGIVDIGLQYQTHGVPASDYFPAGTEAIILANSNGSVTAVTPSNLSQSRIGLSGKEALVGDWSGVFRLETFFNPQSGNISDALKSQVLNNGRPAATQTTNAAHQLQLGLEGGGGSIDLYYSKKYDAVATAPLTAAQVATLPALGYSPSNSLRATISDNTSYSVMGSFGLSGGPILFAGYEHIKFANPNSPLPVGSLTIGGYVIAVRTNTAYDNNKILTVFWGGVKYPATPQLDLMAAFYGYHQDSFATGANTGCSGTQSRGR